MICRELLRVPMLGTHFLPEFRGVEKNCARSERLKNGNMDTAVRKSLLLELSIHARGAPGIRFIEPDAVFPLITHLDDSVTDDDTYSLGGTYYPPLSPTDTL